MRGRFDGLAPVWIILLPALNCRERAVFICPFIGVIYSSHEAFFNMNFGFFRRFFQPLFDLDGRETISRFLNAILSSTIIMLSVLIVLRLLGGSSFSGETVSVLGGLLVVQVLLLIAVRRGYAKLSAVFLVSVGWAFITYQAWHADGVRDAAVYAYSLVIIIAALVTNWRFVVGVSILSIASIWVMALSESAGIRIARTNPPIELALDLTALLVLLIVFVYLLVNTLRESLEKTQVEFSERMRMEEALRERDERFRKVFQVSPVAIIITKLNDGTLMEANQAFWRLTGLDPETSIGSTTVDLKLWENRDERQEFIRKILERKSLSNPDYEFLDGKDGKRPVAAFHELIDRGDEPTILSMFYDQTEQKLAQQALERSEARTRALLEATPDMLFELDRDGTIVQFIPSSTMDPLLPPEEFLGKNINQFMPSVIVEQTMFAIERTLESGQLHVFEYQLPSDDEMKTFEARLINSDSNTVMAMVRDITIRKWVESERENLIEELELKNAELERFTYTVSHDLKSPLITIRGFLGFLKEDMQMGHKVRLEKDIQRIVGATDKMQKLLGDLLDLSRVGRLVNKPENIPFNELVSDVVELLHGRITQGRITVVVQDALPTVHVDRQRFFEVLQNLIDNAAKFMGDQPAPRIEIGQMGEINEMPVIYVRDNGIGIAPEFTEKIFGLFDKLNAQTEGTGIGLALVKRIVEFHGGRIWVESEPGKGATFFFTLPDGENSNLKSG